jgi:acetyl esterase/lipase
MSVIRAAILRTLIRGFTYVQYRDANDVSKVRPPVIQTGSQRFLPRNVRVEGANAGGVPCEWLTPKNARGETLLYIHGGGWVMGFSLNYRRFLGMIARDSGARILAVDYDLAPEHPFPAAQQQCLAAYRWLLAQGISPRQLVIAGESAGGNLALVTLLAARQASLPLPAAAVALSPATDLTYSSESHHSNRVREIMLAPNFMKLIAASYPGEGIDRRNPLVSPIYGDLRGLPPLLLQVGDQEILHDDSVRFADSARKAGVDVTLEIYPGMWHVHQMFSPFLPEAKQALDHINAFIRARAL